MNLLKYRWFFVGIFVVTMLLSVLFLFVNPYNGWGSKPGTLNLGIDFTGGTKIYYPLERPVDSAEVVSALETVQLPNFKFNPPQPNEYFDSQGVRRHQVIIYTRFLNDAEQEVVINTLESKLGQSHDQRLDITRVDPLIGKELVTNAINAVLLASVLMMAYIWFRFEMASGIAAIISMIHDSILVLGIFALLGQEVNATIIAALLTIIGYSINDTIVVFDRIRENMKYKTKATSFVELANISILQTFRRSLNTGLTTILAVCVLYLMVPSIQEFCFALIIGLVSGTYSSIFVASPIWAVYKDWQEKRKISSKMTPATR